MSKLNLKQAAYKRSFGILPPNVQAIKSSIYHILEVKTVGIIQDTNLGELLKSCFCQLSVDELPGEFIAFCGTLDPAREYNNKTLYLSFLNGTTNGRIKPTIRKFNQWLALWAYKNNYEYVKRKSNGHGIIYFKKGT